MLGFVTQNLAIYPPNNILNILLLYLWQTLKCLVQIRNKDERQENGLGGAEEGQRQCFSGE